MTIPFYAPYYEPRKRTPKEPEPPQSPTPEEKDLLSHYQVLRMDIHNLETTMGNDKELDKAVVLMKCGAKLLKQQLRKMGWRGTLKVGENV